MLASDFIPFIQNMDLIKGWIVPLGLPLSARVVSERGVAVCGRVVCNLVQLTSSLSNSSFKTGNEETNLTVHLNHDEGKPSCASMLFGLEGFIRYTSGCWLCFMSHLG